MKIHLYSHPQFQSIVLSDRPGKDILKAVFGLDQTELLLGAVDIRNWTTYFERNCVKRDGRWQSRYEDL